MAYSVSAEKSETSFSIIAPSKYLHESNAIKEVNISMLIQERRTRCVQDIEHIQFEANGLIKSIKFKQPHLRHASMLQNLLCTETESVSSTY
jgi:hypothetical protein